MANTRTTLGTLAPSQEAKDKFPQAPKKDARMIVWAELDAKDPDTSKSEPAIKK